ncbi:MAG: MATE family efflux transporter [Legionellales bacterium]|nr:MATE family efflux transporter [Legionellales bacterium]
MKLFQTQCYPLLILVIPLALTGLIESGVFFFETLFLAHLGPDELAAGGLVAWLFGTFAVILFGVLSSINILIAQKHGAKDDVSISLIVRDGIWLALLLFIPSFLLFWNIPSLFLYFGQSPQIVMLATPYLHALVWGLLPDVVMIALLEVIIGLGHARIILIFSILASALNVLCSFALIFGKFGLPALGIAGAGWGSSISYWISALFLMAYVFTNKNYTCYMHYLFKPTHRSYLLELLHIGTPMGLMYCIEVGFFFILTLLMGRMGSAFLAANQIALQYMSTLMSVIFSIAQAITVRMGHLLGAGEVRSAERVAYLGISMSVFIMLLAAIAYWGFPTFLITLDLDVKTGRHPEIISLAKQFLAIAAVFQLIECSRISLFGALRGLKDTHFTLYLSILSFWGLSLPIGYLLATRLHLGGGGLWWGMVIGSTLCMPILLWRFKTQISRLKPQFMARTVYNHTNNS